MIESYENGNTIEYEYDHDGIRVSSTVNGVKTRYLVDKNQQYAQVLEEIDDASGSLIVAYVYGDDLISQTRGSETYYYLYDGQMSTRMLADSTGTITDEYIYDAFGITLSSAGPTENNYLYTGEQYDPNVGFYYLRARWVSPETGRFISTDPFEGFEYDPQSLHRYTYAHLNPVMNNDPSGEMTLMSGMMTIGALGIIGGIGISNYITYRNRAFTKIHGYSIVNAIKNFNIAINSLIGAMMASNNRQRRDVVDGLLVHAMNHADKLAGMPPGDPDGNERGWKKEVKAALQRAQRMVNKYLKGRTKEELLNKIATIAAKAGVTL